MNMHESRYRSQQRQTQVRPFVRPPPRPLLPPVAPFPPETPFPGKFIKFRENGVGVVSFTENNLMAKWAWLEEEIEKYFGVEVGPSKNQGIRHKPEDIVPDMFVFVKWYDGERKQVYSYKRCQVKKVNSGKGTVNVKNMDDWSYKSVAFSDIYFIPLKFLETPFRVQQIKLKDLEFWCNGSLLNEFSKSLPQFLSTVTFEDVYVSDENRELLIVDIRVDLSKGHRVPRHQWYSYDSISLTQVFQEMIMRYSSIPKHLYRGPFPSHSHISCVDPSGDVWVALHSLVGVRLSNIGKNPFRIKASTLANPSLLTLNHMSDFEYAYSELKQRRFLARFHDDRNYHRVEVESYKAGSKTVKVHYIDYGNKAKIPVEDIMLPQLVDPILTKIHPQCIRAHLNGIKSVVDVDQYFEHFDNDREQNIELVGFYPPEGIPLVDIFVKRNKGEKGAGSKEWIYVNKTIVDKGIAVAVPGGVIPYKKLDLPKIISNVSRRHDVHPFSIEPVLPYRTGLMDENVITINYGRGEKLLRYFATCQIKKENGETYAISTLQELAEGEELPPPVELPQESQDDEDEGQGQQD